MTTQEQPDAAERLSDRFLEMIKPGAAKESKRVVGDDKSGAAKESKRVVEDDEYLRMMWRMVRALEARTIENPELLIQAVALAQRLAELVNVAIAANAERFAIDPRSAASMAECARAMGISKQSASERKQRGAAVMAERIEAAGVAKFSEAKRERQVIEEAHEMAVISLADYRARHAA
jgi:hypothetical protein